MQIFDSKEEMKKIIIQIIVQVKKNKIFSKKRIRQSNNNMIPAISKTSKTYKIKANCIHKKNHKKIPKIM